MFETTQKEKPKDAATIKAGPMVGARPPVVSPPDAATMKDPAAAAAQAQVNSHFAEPAAADVGAIGPNGKKFEKQNQAGASYGPSYQPTEAQKAHMGSGLSDKKLVDMDENFAGGINDISKVKYDSGFKGVFKAETDENNVDKAMAAGIDAHDPKWGNREVGALALDRAMGMNMVPQTEFATHGGYFGTVQEFVKGKTPADIREKDPEQWKKIQNDPNFQSMRADLQAFDYITANQDRHMNNMIIEQDEQGKFKKIHAIDNGISFAPKTDLAVDNTHIHGLPEKYNRDMVAKIEALTPDAMRKQLQGLLKPEEIDAAIERRNKLLADVSAKGEDAFVDDWTMEVARRTAAAGAAAHKLGPEDSTVKAADARTMKAADASTVHAADASTVKGAEELDRAVQGGKTAQDPDKTATDPNKTETGNPLARTISAVRGLIATPPSGAGPDAATQKASEPLSAPPDAATLKGKDKKTEKTPV